MSNNKVCVIFSTADWEAKYWTNKQYTAKALVDQGYKVLYVETIGLRPPTINNLDIRRALVRLKNGLNPIKHKSNNLSVLSPLAIPFKQNWAIIKYINQGFLAFRVKLFLKKAKVKLPLFWTYHPFINEIANRIEHKALIYHCVDDLAQIPGVDANAFNKEELTLLGKSDIVFVTSENLRNKCLPHNSNTHFYSNVVDIKHFQQAFSFQNPLKDLISIPEPKLVYHGVLSNFKVDFSLILKIAENKKNWQIVLIGEEREGQNDEIVMKLKQLKNVHFLGYKPYAELPKYLSFMSVGLLPMLINDYTKSMFPMKYYEYLAAGLPVISTPIDFTKYTTNALFIGDTVDKFIQLIDAQLKVGKLTINQSMEFVGQNTWEVRLEKMLNLIEVEK